MGGTLYGLKSFIDSRSTSAASQVDCSVLSSVDNLDDDNISVFPNPTGGKINITWKDQEVASISLFNMLGVELVSIINNGSNSAEMDLDVYGKGIFFLKLRLDNELKGQQKTVKVLNQ